MVNPGQISLFPSTIYAFLQQFEPFVFPYPEIPPIVPFSFLEMFGCLYPPKATLVPHLPLGPQILSPPYPKRDIAYPVSL